MVTLIDSTGKQQWLRYFTYIQRPDYGRSIVEDANGNLIVAGAYQQAACVLRIRRSDGSLIEEKRYGRAWYDYLGLNQFYAIQPTDDHGFILAGALESLARDTTRNLFIQKIDSALNVVWTREFDFDQCDRPVKMIRTRDGGYAILGLISSNKHVDDLAERMFLLKTNDNGEVSSTETVSAPLDVHLAPSYPNPASRSNSFVTIPYTLSARGHVRIALHDALGREVRMLVDREVDAGNHSYTFSTSSLSPGIHFYRLTAGITSILGKMVVER